VRPKKRFAKWVKDDGDEQLELVCAFYKCNKNVGRDYLSLLSVDLLDMIKKESETGGTNNERGR